VLVTSYLAALGLTPNRAFQRTGRASSRRASVPAWEVWPGRALRASRPAAELRR
jgi:hypothetical protein